MAWLDPDALRLRQPGWPAETMAPHPVQNLTAIPGMVEQALRESAGTVIVLALDGVSFAAADAAFDTQELVALTSTFPSTSVTAWLAATTGLDVADHGVAGVAFRSGGGLFNCLSDRLETLGPEWPDADRASDPPALGPMETMFDRLRASGASCRGYVGDLAAVPGRWSDAVVRGLTRLDPLGDWERLREDPGSVPAVVEAEVDQALAGAPPGKPRLVWTYLHIDPYIHRHGYDASVLDCLRSLGVLARRWQAAGYTVVAHSDHGMIETRSPAALERAFDDLAGPSLCRLPSGGAGRVRWAYPQAGRAPEVLGRLSELLGPRALVCSSRQLEGEGLLRLSPILEERVGEVVAVALGAEFPLPFPARFEHGALTVDEMLVPLAIWEAH